MSEKFKLAFDFFLLAIGAIIAAFAIEEFLVPCTILDGGIVGIGIMLSSLTGIALSVFTIVFNLPFLVLGSKRLGKMFIIKSGFSMVIFSIFLAVFAPLSNATDISDAAGYARGTPALEAVVHAQDADEFALAVNAVNKAVTASLSRGIESAAAVIYPAFLFLSEEKRRSAAEQILESRSTRDDERSRVSLALGSVYLDLGMISAARSMLRAALRANPGSEIRSRILIELAWMESEEGEYKQAVETYRLALKQNERFPAAWAGIAKASIRMGEFEAALSAAKEAVLLNPAEDSYRHMKEALEIVCTEPKSETADKLFCLPGAENTAYAAVLYAEASGLDVAAAWSASSVSDVLAFR